MKTSQFEGKKVSIKQDKNGYILTMSIHPDDVPEEILRDFVGSRYQVVMVRLDESEQPLDRDKEFGSVRTAAMLCKDPAFAQFLIDTGNIFTPTEDEASEWMRESLGVASRSELRTNVAAKKRLLEIQQEFLAWKKDSFHTQSISGKTFT